MKVHFLGTAAAEGFPNVFCRCNACLEARKLGGKNIRTRSSVIIDDIIKFDYSPDSSMQALRDGIDLGSIEHLLFTHTHCDHFIPEDLFCRVEEYAHGLEAPMKIYGNDAVITRSYAELGIYGGNRLAFQLVRPFRPFTFGDTVVTPLPADHDRNETCLLYYVERGGKRLFYGHDTGWFPEDTWEWLKDKKIDLAILDCTHGFTGNNRNSGHMNIETVLEVQREWREQGVINENSQLYVTHFTHNSGMLHDDWEKAFAPAGIRVAYDGLVINV
ncbi:MBL fold metallo-hydrolase [Paenibacillus sp. LHD-117]|uniref:MBL fold metallo-hydrolase n=1 Tax=Paenibacillus sp. LHD-117 TaxID=3071412 RepID=UPI0027E1469A|nr:MBL fold metallo-hydrolase [Paenibacillus sp. LHD-117]MDQ6421343.1 MBL fold metallo-hydrolase [Paenibacillus sp. LHD-117]